MSERGSRGTHQVPPVKLDHSHTPVLDALADYKRTQRGRNFSPPGHKQGGGVDPRVMEVLGADVFASDVLAMSGLDDRRMSQEVLGRAQELMADAVDAEYTFFSTCGSSLSVKSAMLAVAGPYEKLLKPATRTSQWCRAQITDLFSRLQEKHLPDQSQELSSYTEEAQECHSRLAVFAKESFLPPPDPSEPYGILMGEATRLMDEIQHTCDVLEQAVGQSPANRS